MRNGWNQWWRELKFCWEIKKFVHQIRNGNLKAWWLSNSFQNSPDKWAISFLQSLAVDQSVDASIQISPRLVSVKCQIYMHCLETNESLSHRKKQNDDNRTVPSDAPKSKRTHQNYRVIRFEPTFRFTHSQWKSWWLCSAHVTFPLAQFAFFAYFFKYFHVLYPSFGLLNRSTIGYVLSQH